MVAFNSLGRRAGKTNLQHLSSPQTPCPQILHQITQLTLTLSLFTPSPSVPFYSRCCCGQTSGPWLGCVLSRPSARTWCWSVSAPPAGSEWLCPGPAPESQAPAALCPLALPAGFYSSPLLAQPSLDPLHSVSSGQSVERPPPAPQCPGPAPGTALGPRGPLRTGVFRVEAGAQQELCLAVPGEEAPLGSEPSVGPRWDAAGDNRSRRRRSPGRRGPRAPRPRGARSARLGSRRRRQLFPSRERRGAEKGSRTRGGGAGLSAGWLRGAGAQDPNSIQVGPRWGRAVAARGRWRPLARAGSVPSTGSDRASRRHAGVEPN